MPAKTLLFLAFLISALPACRKPTVPPPAKPAVRNEAPVAAPAAPHFDRLTRSEFNRLAAETFLPLFWVDDSDHDAAVDANELVELWGMRRGRNDPWLVRGAFGPSFAPAYEHMVAFGKDGLDLTKAPRTDWTRRQAVLEELKQGRPTLLHTVLTDSTPQEQAFVKQILKAADLIEGVYARQLGSAGLEDDIPEDDLASRALFARNQGPWCEAPATARDPDCQGVPSRPKHVFGVYPPKIQEDPGFCEVLAARPDAKTLLAPFSVVREGANGALEAVPYQDAYRVELAAVSRALQTAADVLGPEEVALATYLRAAAQSMLDGLWEPADEAWAAMNVRNSKWYVRVGPDETYFEPCSRKAAFHLTFARINQDSLRWQDKLVPVRKDMEEALAKLAGKPYKARAVAFHLPDFIDIVLNAGEARSALGATVGQSLPNWGKVAAEGRGRTVAMTNIGTDVDSQASSRRKVESLFCEEAMEFYTTAPEPEIMSTVLHEAAHNLGPAHEYRVKGKTDDESFGGGLAATLEELKAQQAAAYLADWLAAKGIIDDGLRRQAHTGDVAWALGHVSQGMLTPEGRPKPYSQLAAIQVGWLLEAGALSWKPEAIAANNRDKGCLAFDLAKFPAAHEKLMAKVAGIKARGDRKGAEALVEKYVQAPGAWADLREVVRQRLSREPRSSFVYAIELGR
jgi:hypothetical protein